MILNINRLHNMVMEKAPSDTELLIEIHTDLLKIVLRLPEGAELSQMVALTEAGLTRIHLVETILGEMIVNLRKYRMLVPYPPTQK